RALPELRLQRSKPLGEPRKLELVDLPLELQHVDAHRQGERIEARRNERGVPPALERGARRVTRLGHGRILDGSVRLRGRGGLTLPAQGLDRLRLAAQLLLESIQR